MFIYISLNLALGSSLAMPSSGASPGPVLYSLLLFLVVLITISNIGESPRKDDKGCQGDQCISNFFFIEINELVIIH